MEQDLVRAVVENEMIIAVTGEMRRARARVIDRALPLLKDRKVRVVMVDSPDGQPLSLQRMRDKITGGERGMGASKVDRLFDTLTTAKGGEQHILLVVNDAHLLTADALTYLILLSSSASGDAPPLQLVLAGRALMWEFLKRGGNLTTEDITTRLFTDGQPAGPDPAPAPGGRPQASAVTTRDPTEPPSAKEMAKIVVPVLVVLIAGGLIWSWPRGSQPPKPPMVAEVQTPAAQPAPVQPAPPVPEASPVPEATQASPAQDGPKTADSSPPVAAMPPPVPAQPPPAVPAPPAEAATPTPATVEQPVPAAEPAAPPTAVASAEPPPPAAAAEAAAAAATAPSVPVAQAFPPQTLAPPVLAALVKRGKALLAVGDIAAARLVFTRAAAAGSAQAATGLGMTHDPRFLARVGARGIAADPKVAETWYKRAVELGDPDASAMLPGLIAAAVTK